MELNAESVLRPHPDVAFRIVDGTAVLVVARDAKMLTLNRVGSRIWELLDGRTVADIASVLTSEFRVEEDQAARDALDLLGKLLGRGLLFSPEEG